MDLSQLTLEDFIPLLHQPFTVRMENDVIYELNLTEVTGLGAAREPGLRQPFALQFRNPRADAYLPQRTYILEHPQLGSLEIFLVPLGPDAHGMRYEAIFS